MSLTARAAFAVERTRVSRAARQYRHLRTLARITADVAYGVPLPDDDRRRLVPMLLSLTAAETDSQVRPPSIDPASLHDPRAAALAINLAQMVDDLES